VLFRSAPGAAADLLVLSANPLERIANTRAIDAIYIGGRRFDPPAP
jgi:imidazolonepropionase-like amidohydrolase